MTGFVGLDLSLTGTGFAGLTDERFSRKLIKAPKGIRGVIRLELLVHRVMMSIRAVPDIRGIAVEGYAMNGKGRVFDLGELGGCVKLELRRNLLPVIIVPPKTLKMLTTGNGNASKPDMVEAMSTLFGERIEDHNEADALALAVVAKKYYTGNMEGFDKRQTKAMAELEKLPSRAGVLA